MRSLTVNIATPNTALNQPKNLNCIDLIKFIGAILVFIIHIPPFQGEVSGLPKYINFGLQHYLCRVAVPFYFACSGYFLFRKMPVDALDVDRIKDYCFKVLRLIGIWGILLFVGGTRHLWYLGATVTAIIILSLCYHFRLKKQVIYALAGLLYVIGILTDSYNGFIAPLANYDIVRRVCKIYTFVFRTTRNGIFMGFIFVLMGAEFARQKKVLKPVWSAAGFLLSMICLFAEVYLLESHDIPIEYNMYIFLLPAVYFLFSFACTVPLKDHAVYRHLRVIGMLVYFLHVFVKELVILAAGKIGNIAISNYQFWIPLVLTLGIAVFLDWLSGKRGFRWIHWLLS